MATKKVLLSEEEYQTLRSAASALVTAKRAAEQGALKNSTDYAVPILGKLEAEVSPQTVEPAQTVEESAKSLTDHSPLCPHPEEQSSLAVKSGAVPVSVVTRTPHSDKGFPGKFRALAVKVIQKLKDSPVDLLGWDRNTKEVYLFSVPCRPVLTTTELIKIILYPHITRIPAKLPLALNKIRFPKKLIDNPKLLSAIEPLEQSRKSLKSCSRPCSRPSKLQSLLHGSKKKENC